MEVSGQPSRLVPAESLELAAAMLIVQQRRVVREIEVEPVTLLSLHALAAAQQVELDWGVGGWQFFI